MFAHLCVALRPVGECHRCDLERSTCPCGAVLVDDGRGAPYCSDRDDGTVCPEPTCGACVAGLGPCPTHPNAPEGEGP